MKRTQEKGITLIALVVTIIVLIILAVVSISLVLGDNGIITKAKEGKENSELAKVEEEVQLNEAVDYLENLGESSTEVERITALNIEADASYIGKYVNYGGEENFKGVKWRIFNAENGQIQLIADNYIHKGVMPTATNIKKGREDDANTDYCLGAADNRITLLNYINTASNWNEFVAVTGATVTGGPTLEQFKNSYNRTHGASSEAIVKKIFIEKSAEMDDGLLGYYVGTSEKPKTVYIEGLNTTEIENLYVINDNMKANAYWLGSPSAFDVRYLTGVNYNGYVNSYDFSAYIFGLRPLVILPSGVTLVEQANGTYNVVQ